MCVCIYIFFIIIIIKKNPFWWVPVPLLTCILFEIRSQGRGDLVLGLFTSESLMGSPAGACCGDNPCLLSALRGSAPIQLLKLLSAFFLQLQIPWGLSHWKRDLRSEHGVKASNRWGMLPWSASLQSEICRIQASKGCADAHKVLQAQVFIHICSHLKP